MKYLSTAQIHESVRNLRPYNPFFSITFFVLKKAKVPVGSKRRLSLDAENRKFLQAHFKVHPKSECFFRVMRPSDVNKDWLEPDYASSGLQAINTQSFRDALLHDRNDNTWGWTADYVQQLATKLPRHVQIPLFDLAVWLYRDHPWGDRANRKDVVNKIVSEFGLTPEELQSLFRSEVISDLTDRQAFQETPAKWHEILAPFSRPKDVPAEASGILTYLETEGIGPVRRLVFQPASRLNLITGDNGLGKTFLLDLSWWALTQNWAELPATPLHFSPSKPPTIKFVVGGERESRPVRATYSEGGTWEMNEPRATLSGLAVYARLDGSFSVWDPANRTLAGPLGSAGRWPGMKFNRDEVWDGKPGQIEGLIRDWTKWQQRPDRYPAFETFQAVLRRISPPDLGPLTVGDPVRIPNDPREIPTLVHPYDSVPILFESAGIRRIVTLAYLLVWAWEEHKIQAKQQGRSEERQMVVLVDEAEAHLHPKWQRVILPALLGIASDLHSELAVQWIIASHSPLVLASGETVWDDDSDRLFHVEMRPDGKVIFEALEFEKRGTIDSWLSSDVFDIQQPGSTEREAAIQAAIGLQESANPTKREVEAVTRRLREHLTTEDPFWIRWIFFADSFGVSP